MTKKKQDVLVETELTTPETMTAESSQQHINECAQRHQELFGQKPEAESSLFDPTGMKVRETLSECIEFLVDQQHSRAAAGGGQSTPWQNAQAHIKRAIECIEQQAEADKK
jgi:hypothetical protein